MICACNPSVGWLATTTAPCQLDRAQPCKHGSSTLPWTCDGKVGFGKLSNCPWRIISPMQSMLFGNDIWKQRWRQEGWHSPCGTRSTCNAWKMASCEHGYRKRVRFYASGDTCQVCGQLFSTREIPCPSTSKRTLSAIWHCAVVLAAYASGPCAGDGCIQEEERSQTPTRGMVGLESVPASNPNAHRLPSTSKESRGPVDACKDVCQAPKWWIALPELAGPPCRPGAKWVCQSLVDHDNRGNGACDMSGLAREAARLHIRALAIAHFFSGFRRQRDSLHHRSVRSPHTQKFSISVDLCMQRQNANLATHSATKWWVDRVGQARWFLRPALRDIHSCPLARRQWISSPSVQGSST